MDVGSSVSRRTRSRWDAHFRSQIVRYRQDSNIDGNQDNIHESETEIDDAVDSDDYDTVSKRKTVAKKGPRPVKKMARGNGKIDFGSLLEGWDDLVRENPVNVDVDVRESALPLKFKFEEDELAQKTEWEMEIDRLYYDLDVGLWESEGAPTDSCVSDDDEWSSQIDDVDQSIAARCSRGEHDPVLDEQIGIKCIYCHAVLLDIKYVLPPFCDPQGEGHGEYWRNLEELKNPDQIQFMGSYCNNLESNIPSTGTGTGTVFDLIPNSEEELYPHQLEGFEFMWRNIAKDINMSKLKRLPSKGGRGCIISHAPGSGKTRLTILFLQTFIRLYPRCRPVIIAPRGMLLTWEQELKKWKGGMNFHNLNEARLSDEEAAVAASVGEGGQRSSTDYIRSMKLLCWMKGGSILGVGYRLFEELAVKKFKKMLLEAPSIVVLDEGHTPRNHQSLMWKVLTKVATRRRIILSGTPFQNNFDELYSTLSLVNPRFMGEVSNGEWGNMTRNDEGMKKLRIMIQPFVHIHKCSSITLPGVIEWLIVLIPTEVQQKLLNENMGRRDNLALLASLISVHPWLVAQVPEFAHHRTELKPLQSNPKAGVKTHFLINLIRLSSLANEKVLIFGEFIKPLAHLMTLLQSHFKWNEGRQVMFIHGGLNMKQRQSLITSFNDRNNNEAKVLLASQKACCEGISLVGASRVVLLNVSWNPAVERQAICRAYRVGQQKMVHVYHLATSMEVSTKYARQTEKDRISDLIFSPLPSPPASGNQPVSQDHLLEAMLRHQTAATMFHSIIYQPKESHFAFTD